MTEHCHISDAPMEIEATGIHTGVVGYLQGIPAEPRPEVLGYNSGVLCVVMSMILLLIFAIRNFKTFFRTLFQDAWSLRKRDNVFDEKDASATGGSWLLGLQVCVWESLILLGIVNYEDGSIMLRYHVMILTAMLMGAVSAFYLFQLGVYKILGYVFSDGVGSDQLMRGFTSTQGLLGFSLLFPALGILFYPSAVNMLIIVGLVLYILARLIFICKGFRIFYDNYSSILYFFLYLCSLEVVPLALIYKGILLLNKGYII